MEIPSCLFADPGSVECSAVEIAEDGSIMRLETGSVTDFGICPRCNHICRRVHCRSTRTLADLPWAGIPVQIRIRARRFYCDRSECEQTIFTERLPVDAHGLEREGIQLDSDISVLKRHVLFGVYMF